MDQSNLERLHFFQSILNSLQDSGKKRFIDSNFHYNQSFKIGLKSLKPELSSEYYSKYSPLYIKLPKLDPHSDSHSMEEYFEYKKRESPKEIFKQNYISRVPNNSQNQVNQKNKMNEEVQPITTQNINTEFKNKNKNGNKICKPYYTPQTKTPKMDDEIRPIPKAMKEAVRLNQKILQTKRNEIKKYNDIVSNKRMKKI